MLSSKSNATVLARKIWDQL